MIDVIFLTTGYCEAPGKIAMHTDSWKKKKFPALATVLKHPKHGVMLFDTGYTDAFFTATDKFPYRLYRWTTKVCHLAHQTVKHQLNDRGISETEVKYIFLSHLHADHMCGLEDFPHAQFIVSQEALDSGYGSSGMNAVRGGGLPGLFPKDFLERTIKVEKTSLEEAGIIGTAFSKGIDFFGDKSMILIYLPGHAPGQMGMLVNRNIFLIADGAWSLKALQENKLPHNLAYLIHASKKDYLETFENLHLLTKTHPTIKLVPSHEEFL
jgi:glyoxylase-like metal-dependent hydrolase (beta-lactamase superfamily II)